MSYVSFDIYDTLIKRILSPEVLYQAMENCGNNKFSNFAKNRICAEQELRREGRLYYTLREIYHMGAFSELDDEIRESLIQYEEECEIENAMPNREGLELYNAYSKTNKLICISDMYLSSTVLRRILNKNGYTHIKKIYVSCEECKSKRQGGVFRKVLDDLEISGKELIHIGDAVRSDFLIPKNMEFLQNLSLLTRDIMKKRVKSYIIQVFQYLDQYFMSLWYGFMSWHREDEYTFCREKENS